MQSFFKVLLESSPICITMYQQEHLIAKKCDWGKSKISPKSIKIIKSIEILPFKLEQRVKYIEKSWPWWCGATAVFTFLLAKVQRSSESRIHVLIHNSLPPRRQTGSQIPPCYQTQTNPDFFKGQTWAPNYLSTCMSLNIAGNSQSIQVEKRFWMKMSKILLSWLRSAGVSSTVLLLNQQSHNILRQMRIWLINSI